MLDRYSALYWSKPQVKDSIECRGATDAICSVSISTKKVEW